MTATAKCRACGGTGIVVKAPLWVSVTPAGAGRAALTFDGWDKGESLTYTSGLCAECCGTESAAESRARLGWRELTDAERDEQLRRNLDDLCPAEKAEVTS